jgi:GNAT superfamily N-acetyltransferase
MSFDTSVTVNVKIRQLTLDDISQALELSGAANWNQTEADWTMLIECFPETCICLECDGEIAATTTLAQYEQRLGWVGMVLTRPAFRRRGFARLLLERILAMADRLGIESLKLDATDQGLPLYESLGFRSEQPIERWYREGQPKLDGRTQPASGEMAFARDEAFFGANREQLLRKLAERAQPLVADDAYLFHRPGRHSAYIGPCIAKDSGSARNLLAECFHQNPAASYFWDLLPGNTDAAALAREFGFAQQRRLVRMVRGKDLASDDRSIYAIAGFELG